MTSKGDHIRLDKGTVVKHHYEVVAAVGSGNFSKVYRVIDLQLSAKEQKRKPLAMKVIKKEYSSDAKYEKQMLIALHKNDKNHTARVSKMYECFVFQECPVFIMPIHGPSIRNRRLGINRGVVTHTKLMEFAFDILETLDFVHFQCHMVHTDLKPENILIADSDVAENSMGDEWVVCDFGSASLWRMDKLDSDLISTRPYRAPEVVLGNKWHYAADMWSVGCILYEVAVGHRLFEIRDDLTHLHMMDRRVGKLPETFTKNSRYSSKFFNARGEFISTPDVIRFGKCRLTPLRDMFRDDKDFLNLLEGLLVYDPAYRMTATEALALPMFDDVRVERQKRLEREAKEAEERRQRRRAAAAALDNGNNAVAGNDSLMSTVNSMSGTINTRLTDRTDRNMLGSTEDAKKTPRAGPATTMLASSSLHLGETLRSPVSTSKDDAAATASLNNTHHTELAAGGSRVHGHEGVASAEDTELDARMATHDSHTPLTSRSTTETTTSRQSRNVLPHKALGKSRSNAGIPSLNSTVVSNSGAPTHAKTPGRARSRAGSMPAAVAKGGSSSGTSGSGAVARTSATVLAPTGADVSTKDGPNRRPSADHHPHLHHHRASTGNTSALPSTTVVPKLALSRLTGNDAASNAATITSGSSSKGARAGGSGTKHGSRQLPRKSTNGTVSPGEQSLGKAKTLSSHTPRKAGRPSYRGSDVSADEGAAAAAAKKLGSSQSSLVVPHMPDSTAAGTASSAGSTRNSRSEATGKKGRSSLALLQLQASHNKTSSPPSPAVAAASTVDATGTAEAEAKYSVPAALQLGSSVVATTSPMYSAGTPVRASSATAVGYQSPLERGVTAIGITTRTEPPIDTNSPADEGETEVEKDKEGNDKDDRHESPSASGRNPTADASEGNDDVDGSAAASENDDEADSSNLPSLGATTATDFSPRATDYRSPVRRRPVAVTPTEDASAATSPDTMRRSYVGASASSGEWASLESAASPLAAAAPPKTLERFHPHAFSLTQPALSDGRRTPREVSPAPVTGRTGSPITTVRRSQQLAAIAGPAAASAKAAASTKETNVYELASTVPIVRAPLSRGNSPRGSLTSSVLVNPILDTLVRTTGPNFASTPPAVPHDASPAPVEGRGAGLRSPPNGSVAPRVHAASSARPDLHLTPASGGGGGGSSGTPSAGRAASSPSPAAPVSSTVHAVVSPSTQPPNSLSAKVERLRLVPPSNIADVRGPSAIPVCASRRTVVKLGPSFASPNSNSNSINNSSNSGIPAHPISRSLSPLQPAPQNSADVPRPPEAPAVTRPREPALAARDAETAAATTAPSFAVPSAVDAATPKTPLPSTTSTTTTAAAIAGPASCSSLSLSTATSHPTVGVVRQRNDSTQLVLGHPTSTSSAGGREGNLALSVSQLGVFTPRGTRLLTEPPQLSSGRSSATLPAVLSGNNNNNYYHSSGGGGVGAPTSPTPPPSRGSRTMLFLTSPSAAVSDLEPPHSRPTTPLGSGRVSVKALDLQLLHTSMNTITAAAGGGGAQGGTRLPVSSSVGHAGGKSPRYNAKPGALSASTSSLHLGVTRSPRKPLAPGAGSSGNTGNSGSASLMASLDGAGAASLRSPLNSGRAAISPHESGSRKAPSRTTSPRRGPLSPRTTLHSRTAAAAASSGNSNAIAADPSSPAAAASSAAATSPVALGVPVQLVHPQPAPTQGAARVVHPRHPMTLISSKPSSGVTLSRYSNMPAVAPTRASTNKLPPASAAGSYDKQLSTTGAAAASNATSSNNGAKVRQSPTAESASVGNTESEAPMYRRNARTLRRIVVPRPSSQSSTASMVSPQEMGDEGESSASPATSAL
ncbi:protein kinase-like protein [Leptomonas pyrrhocoris]|uniref:Protein kinase-like protein n=1 Tax=Leptomonas pyrrhocoris TaxID=157538 RepID=A0A0M9G7T2_LEPPY|nr:protein kinase-like protein [Leptomonas pyrrhocoris]KPA84323.1 protein kinase-like protein [Leptomonas pyrrhocoris]|eukprot:XP_015662762.1 protein kinase-like protein [Leptomonas pyrrhocoris]